MHPKPEPRLDFSNPETRVCENCNGFGIPNRHIMHCDAISVPVAVSLQMTGCWWCDVNSQEETSCTAEFWPSHRDITEWHRRCRAAVERRVWRYCCMASDPGTTSATVDNTISTSAQYRPPFTSCIQWTYTATSNWVNTWCRVWSSIESLLHCIDSICPNCTHNGCSTQSTFVWLLHLLFNCDSTAIRPRSQWRNSSVHTDVVASHSDLFIIY